MDLTILKKIELEIPLLHMAVFSLLCSLLALAGKVKFVLVVAYGAVIYWVFIINETKFDFIEDGNLLHTGLFILTSIIFVACAAWVLFIER